MESDVVNKLIRVSPEPILAKEWNSKEHRSIIKYRSFLWNPKIYPPRSPVEFIQNCLPSVYLVLMTSFHYHLYFVIYTHNTNPLLLMKKIRQTSDFCNILKLLQVTDCQQLIPQLISIQAHITNPWMWTPVYLHNAFTDYLHAHIKIATLFSAAPLMRP